MRTVTSISLPEDIAFELKKLKIDNISGYIQQLIIKDLEIKRVDSEILIAQQLEQLRRETQEKEALYVKALQQKERERLQELDIEEISRKKESIIDKQRILRKKYRQGFTESLQRGLIKVGPQETVQDVFDRYIREKEESLINNK